MRIAIVHPYPVWRRAVGGTTRVDLLVRHLAGRHEVTVLTHASGDREADAAAIADLASIGVEQRIFARPRPSPGRKIAWALAANPYFVGFNRNPGLEAALGALEREGALDVVHVEFAYLAPLLGGLGPRVARSLAEQETMSVMIERLRAVPGRRRSLYQIYLGHELDRVRRFEAGALCTFDRAWAISPGEAEVLSRLAGRRIGVLPHVVSAAAFSPPAVEPVEPGLLFVGNYGHDPNRHAIRWFAEEVWPRVRESIPDARLDVVGPHLPADDATALEGPGVRLRGRVEDLAGAYREAAVFVNPIRSGGGMRGKVLEAFACGRPVVSTGLGMEGIAARDGIECDLADEPAAFAGATIRLLGDAALRHERGARSRLLVERLYDAPAVFSRLEEAWCEAIADRRARPAVGRVA